MALRTTDLQGPISQSPCSHNTPVFWDTDTVCDLLIKVPTPWFTCGVLLWQQLAQLTDGNLFFFFFFFLNRDPQPAGGAVQMPGAAVGVSYPAAAGPAGVLSTQSRDRTGIFPQPGETGRALLLQDPQLQRTSAIQVSVPPCWCDSDITSSLILSTPYSNDDSVALVRFKLGVYWLLQMSETFSLMMRSRYLMVEHDDCWGAT